MRAFISCQVLDWISSSARNLNSEDDRLKRGWISFLARNDNMGTKETLPFIDCDITLELLPRCEESFNCIESYDPERDIKHPRMSRHDDHFDNIDDDAKFSSLRHTHNNTSEDN
mmetsp:Transcript_26214/g.52193  ORF Transcript_26214/g.52193 Transcript_26214/m.52193 type:complete len:114 (+) Transcript_26214:1303-1644(+)